jgi:hypothetical protein
MENRINPYRGWKVEFIADILNIPFDLEWIKFFVIKFITRPYYLNISS